MKQNISALIEKIKKNENLINKIAKISDMDELYDMLAEIQKNLTKEELNDFMKEYTKISSKKSATVAGGLCTAGKKIGATALSALIGTATIPLSSVNATVAANKNGADTQSNTKNLKSSGSTWKSALAKIPLSSVAKVGAGIAFLAAASWSSYELYEHRDNFKNKDQLLEELPTLFKQCYWIAFNAYHSPRSLGIGENCSEYITDSLEKMKAPEVASKAVRDSLHDFTTGTTDIRSEENSPVEVIVFNRISIDSDRWKKPDGDLYKMIESKSRDEILDLVKALRSSIHRAFISKYYMSGAVCLQEWGRYEQTLRENKEKLLDKDLNSIRPDILDNFRFVEGQDPQTYYDTLKAFYWDKL